MSKNKKSLLVFFDIILISLLFYLSFQLRFEFKVPVRYFTPRIFFKMLAIEVFLRILVFAYLGFYNRIWDYASIGELKTIIRGVTFSSILIGLVYYLDKAMIFTRSVLLIDWALTILAIGGVRFIWRLDREAKQRKKPVGKCKNVLVIGAGDAGDLVIRELNKHQELHYNIVGVIDDDPLKRNMVLHGYKVLGDRYDIENIIPAHNVEEVIIAIPGAPGHVIRDINSLCHKFTNIKVKTLPGVYELIDGKVDFKQLREVQVEDLLRRDPIRLDIEQIAGYLKGKVVMVTGGGGSIGSELVRQIIRFSPQKVIIFDIAENSVFYIHREILSKIEEEIKEDIEIIPIVGSIQDFPKVNKVFQDYRPQVVFHAAAYKHVPLMEMNPEEAVKNNVFGTFNVVEAAHLAQVERFVLISSDKAVNPGNIMGATKRIAEMIIQAKAWESKTEFVTVRFGNVLGSQGSVIPCFQDQIKRRVPITLTDKDITRYFMTIPEAVQLVIQAGAIARGGEIFVLDMGEPVKILDLAKDLIRLSGLEPEIDIPIKYIGLRPGDKLKEELAYQNEKIDLTSHGRIMVVRDNQVDYNKMIKQIRELENLLFRGSTDLCQSIAKIIPGFAQDTDYKKQSVL